MFRKVEVKPFVDPEMKEIIYKLKFITKRSVNSICDSLCTNAIENNAVDELKKHFRRKIQINDISYDANVKPVPLKKSNNPKTERISLQLDESIYEVAYSLSFAIGCSVAKAVALLLEKSMENKTIVTQYIKEFILEKLNHNDYKHIMYVINEINKKLEKEGHQMSRDQITTSLVFYVFEEFKNTEESLGNVLLKASNAWG